MLYTAYTNADVALTAATAKTALYVITPSNFNYQMQIREIGAEFEGAPASTDCLVELLQSTAATAGTSGSSAGIVQTRGARAIGATTAISSGGLGLTVNQGYTAEPTVLSALDTPMKVTNGLSLIWQMPLDEGPEFPAPGGQTGGIALRLTSPISVNARCHIRFAIGWR